MLTCLVPLIFVVEYGLHPVYVLNLVAHLVITGGVVVQRFRVVAGFLLAYAGLAGLAILAATSPVNLGVSPVLLAAPYSLYLLTRRGPSPRWGTVALLLGIAGSFMSPALRLTTEPTGFTGAAAGLVLLHVLVLVLVHLIAADRHRAEQDQIRENARRAAAQAEAAAERVRHAAEAERTRIAREVHDIVAHSLSVAQVQAATALKLGGAEAQREALTVIRDASRAALTETRALVGMLRDNTETGPTGDLSRIPALIATAQESGVDVRAEIPDDLAGWQTRLSAPMRLAIVRGVQEILTNALRYAGPPTVTLTLNIDHDEVRLSATNPSVAVERTPGYGLIGLKERVTAVGGSLEITTMPTTPDPGQPFVFQIRVSIPQDVS